MSDQPKRKKGPGPVCQALFQEVPFILDSLWRHGEFRASRIGTVDYLGKGDLKLRAAWMSGTFIMFVLLCTFAVFGPTLDAMCSVENIDFARGSRAVGALVLCLFALAIFFPTLNSTTYHLWRKGEDLVNQRCAENDTIRERWANVRKRIDADEQAASSGRQTFSIGANNNLKRLAATYQFIAGRDAFALTTALFVLICGAALLTAPFIITAATLVTVKIDTLSCIQVVNEKFVWAQVAVWGAALVGGFILFNAWGATHPFRTFVATFALLGAGVCLLWFVFSPPHPSESAGGFYPHVFTIILGALLAMALFAHWFARRLFRKLSADAREKFRAALTQRDLLDYERDPPDVSPLRIWSALVNGFISHLLHFLLMPAFVAFVAPADLLHWLVAGFAVVSLVLLTYGSLSSRWEQMLVYVERWFLVGTPRVLSVAVIVIAGLRLFGVTYVSTVMDATPVGVLFIIVIMLYVAVWYFEYWLNRWVGGELLAVLDDGAAAERGYTRCAYAPEKDTSWAKPDHRYLALHGTGRFCALGWYEGSGRNESSKAARGLAFSTYTFVELFAALAGKDPAHAELAKEVRRRISLYFNVINILLVFMFGALIAWHLNWSRPLVVTPMVNVMSKAPKEAQPLATQVAQAPQEANDDSLGDRLIEQAAHARPSIVVAASGGGTRAAVYTAVALEGMAKIDRAQDIVLLSGVSGGGVSAAVFASRFDTLTNIAPKPLDDRNPWSQYVTDVGEPFIQDVLEGIGEVRIWGPASLGALLEESLARRAFNEKQTHTHWMSDLKKPGLILNTAISGHPYDDAEILKDRIATPKLAKKLDSEGNCVRDARPYASLAGGRLIFTNIQNTSGFPQRSPDAPDMWLPYRIINFGKVELPAAAALTANFPPVFSNARVRISSPLPDECPQSYFVTDGCATENLGLVSALFALKGTLDRLPAEQKLTDIHVLALEASAIDYDYSDDRGLGAATGGSKERINAGLTQLLLTEIHALAEEKFGISVYVHYLPLPVAFRSRGGFGTHWMFAPIVRVANPHLPEKPDDSMFADAKADTVDLDRGEVTATLRALFDPQEPICERAARIAAHPENATKDYTLGWTVDTQRVARWICRYDDQRGREAPMPDYQVDAWKKAIAFLKPATAASPASSGR